MKSDDVQIDFQYGETITNIVVVQFSNYVQTGRDKRFNLTCLFRGPGEAVVTSGYIGAGYARSYRLRGLASGVRSSARVKCHTSTFGRLW